MKKFALVALLMLFLLIILTFTISYATAEKLEQCRDNDFKIPGIIKNAKLPESLTIIEDEAFEGTALVKVELPDNVVKIGERAFADIAPLQNIRIPITTSFIASTAFDGNDRTTITAPVNSYARTYARTQGLPFSPIVMFCASTQSSLVSIFNNNRSTEVVEIDDEFVFKPENQWKIIEEINVTRTEELIANHVQGRSPPMA